jgi:hypothetical protein
MFKKLLILIVIVIIGFCAVVSQQPADFSYTRTVQIDAAPETIFPHVNSLRKWEDWSPWAVLDPNAKTTFEGADEGTGAIMHWDGNNKVGKGSMTITDSQPNSLIRFRLNFLKPMQATNNAEFTFTPEGTGTKVSWNMSGTNNFMGKAIGLIMDCETMIGEQFDQGLKNLEVVAKAETANAPITPEAPVEPAL